MESLLQFMAFEYIKIIQTRRTAGPIVFNTKIQDIVTLSAPARKELERRICSKRNHSQCLPHLCVRAQLNFFTELKQYFAYKAFISETPLMKFSLGCDHYPNPTEDCLTKLGYSLDYAKKCYVVPNENVLVLKNMTMYASQVYLTSDHYTDCWSITDPTATREEAKDILESNRKDLELVGAINIYSI